MRVLIDLTEFYSENIRLVKALMKRESGDEFPSLLKWKLQMLFFNNKWIEICRIDNYSHEGKIGSHIHCNNRVIRIDLSYKEAEKSIKDISKRILKDKYGVDLR